jgi:hypothetical protein
MPRKFVFADSESVVVLWSHSVIVPAQASAAMLSLYMAVSLKICLAVKRCYVTID